MKKSSTSEIADRATETMGCTVSYLAGMPEQDILSLLHACEAQGMKFDDDLEATAAALFQEANTKSGVSKKINIPRRNPLHPVITVEDDENETQYFDVIRAVFTTDQPAHIIHKGRAFATLFSMKEDEVTVSIEWNEDDFYEDSLSHFITDFHTHRMLAIEKGEVTLTVTVEK